MVTIGWLRGRPAAEPSAPASPKFHTAPCASASQKLSEGMADNVWTLRADVLAPATETAPTPRAVGASARRARRAAAADSALVARRPKRGRRPVRDDPAVGTPRASTRHRVS